MRSRAAVSRLDRQTQATTLIHQIFGGYLRSRGECWLPGPGPVMLGAAVFLESLAVKIFWENC